MTLEDKRALIEQLKKEISKLEYEEQLLRKRDERLRWEQEMLEAEDKLRKKNEASPVSAPQDFLDREAPPPEAQVARDELEPGTTYIIFEPKPERSIQLYLKEMRKGKKGLFITRVNPNHVKSEYKLADSKVYWLTSVKSTNDTPSVSGLQELSILVSNQVDEDGNSIILLDGVEYLVSNNDFSIVLRLIQQIRDKVSTSDSVMIIPLNDRALETKQVILFERECSRI